jgi:hypothetical protein
MNMSAPWFCLNVFFGLTQSFMYKWTPGFRQVYSCEDFNETQIVDMKI